MRGREPIGDRVAERLRLLVVLEVAIFIALMVIFIADFVHDYQNDMERFVVRLVAYQMLALVAAFISSLLLLLRSYRWEAHDGLLVLEHWGELSGEHQVVRLRIQEGQGDTPYLEAVLANGEVARLAKGAPAKLEAIKGNLSAVLRPSRS